MEYFKDKISNHPTIFIGIAKLVLVAATYFGLDGVVVKEALYGLVVVILGGGTVAEWFSVYGPKTYKQQVAYALSLDPAHWQAAIEAFNVDSKEAKRLIGAEEDDTADDEPGLGVS